MKYAQIFKSSSTGSLLIGTQFKDITDFFTQLIEFQTYEHGYTNIFYGNIRGERVYSDGTGATYKYFKKLPIELIETMYTRAKTTCIENCQTITRFKDELKRRDHE